MHSNVFASALAAAFLTSVAAPATAQTVWTHRPGGTSVELELLRPNFSSQVELYDGTSAAGFLTFRTPLGARWALVADLPFSRAGFAGPAGGSAHDVGNPYLGVDWRRSDRFTAELGLRIPMGEALADDEDLWSDLAVMSVGVVGEIERMEAFVPATLGIYALGNWTFPLERGFTARLRGGPSFLGGEGAAENLHLHYGGQLWYGRDRWNVGGGLTGRWVATSDDGWGDDTVHQVVFAGDHGFGRVRPGLQIRVPLDGDSSDLAATTLALSLGVALR